MKRIGRLHILTDTVLQSRFSHTELTALAVAGGADTIQLRQKSGATAEMIRVAEKMNALCAERGVTFIVNDRVDIAMAAQSRGVHLGQEDFPIPLARKFLGRDCIIGGSASTMEEAQTCLAQGADYIGFGPVFQTSSKGDAGPVSGLKTLRKVVTSIPLPIIAIGGIGLENVGKVLQTGAHGIAVISSVCCQEDPREAARLLHEAICANKVGGDHD